MSAVAPAQQRDGEKYIIPKGIGPRVIVARPYDSDEVRELVLSARRQRTIFQDERSSYFSHWLQINKYISPRRGKWLNTPRGSTKQSQGQRKSGAIINNTAGKASSVAAAGLHSGLTPRSRRWFNLVSAEPRARRSTAAKQWLAVVTDLINLVFQRSNFYKTTRSNIKDTIDYGTGVYSIVHNFESVIHCQQHPIGSYYLRNNHLNETDGMLEEFTLTVEQMVQRFEWDNLSRKVQELFNNGNPHAWVSLIRIVEPNGDAYEPNGIGWKRGEFREMYFDPSDEDGSVLGLAPMFELPFSVSLGETMEGEVYGTDCFGMQALDDVKGLQVYEHRIARMLQGISDPALMGSARLKGKRGTPRPGEMVFVDDVQGAGAIKPIYIPDPRIQELRISEDAIEKRINEAYHRDVFQAVTLIDRGNMREIEVDARIREQMGQLGPVVENATENLDTTIIRTYRIMERAGIIPDPPEELKGRPVEIDYISILAQAQKAQDIGGLDEMAAAAAGMTEMGQLAAGFKFNGIEYMNLKAEKIGVDPRLMNSDEEAQAQAQQIEQARAAEAQAELQSQYASAAKQASETQMADGTTALDTSLEAVRNQ